MTARKNTLKSSVKLPLRSLGADVTKKEGPQVEDVLASFADGRIDLQALYAAYAAHKGEDLEQSDEMRELIAGVVSENFEDAMPGQEGFDPAMWADLIHDARSLDGGSTEEITDAITDEKRKAMMIATRDHAAAFEYGSHLSETFQAEVATTVKNDIRKARLPIICAADLTSTFGLDTILFVFPRPGSKGKSYTEGNKTILFDKYKIGDDDDKHGDFYRDMYLATAQGKADAEEVKWSNLASEDTTRQDILPFKWRSVSKDGAGNPEALSKETCKEMAAPAAKRISTGAALLRRTVGYLQAFHLIKGEFPLINMRVTKTKQLDDEGNPVVINGVVQMTDSTGPTPIQMFPLEDVAEAKTRRFSPDSLARLFVGEYPNTGTGKPGTGIPKIDRIRQLIAEGTTQWSAVMGAIKRQPKGESAGGSGTNVTEVKVPAFTNDETARQAMQELSRWFIDENGEAVPNRRSALLTYLSTKKDEDRKDRILTIGSLCLLFDTVWPKIQADYDRYRAEDVADGNKQERRQSLAQQIASQHNAGTAKPAPKGFPQPSRKAG